MLAAGSGGSTITNLEVRNFSGGTGIRIQSSGNTVQDVQITGVADGIDVDSGSNDNLIGGSFSADEGNVIYDYTAGGIAIDASSGTKVQGNTVGLDGRRRPGRRRLRHRRQRLDRRGRRGCRRPG